MHATQIDPTDTMPISSLARAWLNMISGCDERAEASIINYPCSYQRISPTDQWATNIIATYELQLFSRTIYSHNLLRKSNETHKESRYYARYQTNKTRDSNVRTHAD